MCIQEIDIITYKIREYQNKYSRQKLLIAIDGRCAAGMTTLASILQEKLDCNVIHMDDFFLQPLQRTSERLAEIGGNIDYERFEEEVLIPFSKGQEMVYHRYDCKSRTMKDVIRVRPDKLTIAEGAYSCHPKFVKYYDYKIFMNISYEEQIERIRKRNGEERLKDFVEMWIPKEEKYISTYCIPESCDMQVSVL